MVDIGDRGASAQSQRKGAVAPCSWTPQESQVESCEHQDNANIHCQPFPESVSEEQEIYTDYDGCHRHRVKHDRYLCAHFRFHPPEARWPQIGFHVTQSAQSPPTLSARHARHWSSCYENSRSCLPVSSTGAQHSASSFITLFIRLLTGKQRICRAL